MEPAVHPARSEDVPEIARLQRDTWRTAYAELLPATVLAGLDDPESEQAWRHALDSEVVRLFVATEGAWTVGFAAAGRAPAEDVTGADGALPADAATVGVVSTLLVEPRWARRGHGGRLLAAAATALREQGCTRGVAWVPEQDEASIRFYLRARWTADGTVRTLDAGGQPLREIRFTGTLDLTLTDRSATRSQLR
jgi:GNAT superfamily N-acetyltransferase